MTKATRISADNFANVMGVSKATMQKWEENGTFVPHTDENGKKYFDIKDLMKVSAIKKMAESSWDEEMLTKPLRPYTSIELFAGGGGLALGMEKAGFHHVMLNEFDAAACKTLRTNRPEWNIIEGDVCSVDFSQWAGKVDFISGGFPCQAFSYAGKGEGFNDTRGTLFFQLARAVKEIKPKVFMGENVKGLTAHDNGRTLQTIKEAIKDLGYTLIEPEVLKAICYNVPQKRERLILIAVRNDYADKIDFAWPAPYHRIVTLRDAFFAGELYDRDVPESEGQKYPEKKKRVLAMVPEGGDWRDLPDDVQRDYMGASYFLGGGKTGMARRLSLDEPSLTLTCAPAQKQTERCHPTETRPLTVREYARIQTFPDDWVFMGNLSAQYKQIGNAVPVNLAWAVGRAIIRLMNQIEKIDRGELRAPAKRYSLPSDDWGKHNWIQGALFEPEALYYIKRRNMLIGSCRQGTKQWIQDSLYYNYPIEETELEEHPELLRVGKLVVKHRKTIVGYYDIKEVKVVTKKDLKELGYPVKSSKRKADAKYLLYSLKPRKDEPQINQEHCKLILGKGVK